MTPEERIDRIRGDHWIAFDRATIVLNRLTSLMEMPQQSRMPGLMVYGSSGIGKTMIAKRMASKYPTQYNAELGVTKTPILLVQAPPAPDERRFYQHILSTIGAPMWGRHTVSELEVRALSHLRDMDLKMLMIDEVHNLLAGSYREQRRFLNMLRFLSNDLCASLRTILKVTGGVTSRVFIMIKSLAIEAIETGEERITDEAVQSWQPVWAKHAWNIPRQPAAAFG